MAIQFFNSNKCAKRESRTFPIKTPLHLGVLDMPMSCVPKPGIAPNIFFLIMSHYYLPEQTSFNFGICCKESMQGTRWSVIQGIH